jgi:hypothetical protein
MNSKKHMDQLLDHLEKVCQYNLNGDLRYLYRDIAHDEERAAENDLFRDFCYSEKVNCGSWYDELISDLRNKIEEEGGDDEEIKKRKYQLDLYALKEFTIIYERIRNGYDYSYNSKRDEEDFD